MSTIIKIYYKGVTSNQRGGENSFSIRFLFLYGQRIWAFGFLLLPHFSNGIFYQALLPLHIFQSTDLLIFGDGIFGFFFGDFERLVGGLLQDHRGSVEEDERDAGDLSYHFRQLWIHRRQHQFAWVAFLENAEQAMNRGNGLEVTAGLEGELAQDAKRAVNGSPDLFQFFHATVRRENLVLSRMRGERGGKGDGRPGNGISIGRPIVFRPSGYVVRVRGSVGRGDGGGIVSTRDAQILGQFVGDVDLDLESGVTESSVDENSVRRSEGVIVFVKVENLFHVSNSFHLHRDVISISFIFIKL